MAERNNANLFKKLKVARMFVMLYNRHIRSYVSCFDGLHINHKYMDTLINSAVSMFF